MFVDQTQVGTINPTSAVYATFQIPFSVGAGAHTIMLQGTSAGASTVLLDAIAFQTGSTLSGVAPQKRPVTVEFLAQPESGSAGRKLAPVLVEVFDRSGKLWGGLQVRLTLIRIGKGSRGHFVRGSVVQAKTVGGVATFRRLKISGQAGTYCVPR